MTTFSGELLRFIGELRLAEVPVSVAETLDAMRAVAAAGLGDRARMREALAAALVKNEADREAFDEVAAPGDSFRDTGVPFCGLFVIGLDDTGHRKSENVPRISC